MRPTQTGVACLRGTHRQTDSGLLPDARSAAWDEHGRQIKTRKPVNSCRCYSLTLSFFLFPARASYTAGQADPYPTELGKHGFKLEDLTAALNGLEQLKDVNEAHRKASGDALKATTVRNQAHDDLMVWMGKFKRIAKVALRGQPELRSKLKL